MKQYKMTAKRCEEFGFDYIGTLVVGLRELHHIVCTYPSKQHLKSPPLEHLSPLGLFVFLVLS